MAFVILFSLNTTAQYTNSNKDSLTAFKKTVFSDSTTAKPTAIYIYREPANELMRWPNYPLTAEQVQRNMDNNAEKNKILPSVINQILRSKKKITGTTPPKF